MFENKTTADLKAQVLSEIDPTVGISTMAGSYADAVAGPLCPAGERVLQDAAGSAVHAVCGPWQRHFPGPGGPGLLQPDPAGGDKGRCSVTFTGTAGTVISAGTAFDGHRAGVFLLAGVTIGSGGTAVGELEAARWAAPTTSPPTP